MGYLNDVQNFVMTGRPTNDVLREISARNLLKLYSILFYLLNNHTICPSVFPSINSFASFGQIAPKLCISDESDIITLLVCVRESLGGNPIGKAVGF